MIRPRLLVIGGKESSLRGMSRLPIDMVLFQEESELDAFQRQQSIFKVHLLDLNDEALVLTEAKRMHLVKSFAGVVSFAEKRLLQASVIGEALGIPCNPVAPVAVTRDKASMRNLLLRANLPSVRHAICETVKDLEHFLSGTGRSCIVKPRSGSGSRGVRFVDKIADAADAFEHCAGASEGQVLVEEFIRGPEFSVETMSETLFDGEVRHHIVAITAKTTTEEPYFIETGHIMPAPLATDQAERIENTVRQFLDLIGQKVGPAHTELRLENGVPFIIESQTRFGGDQIWEMVELTTGRNLASWTASRLLRVDDVVLNPIGAAAAIQFFSPSNVCLVEVSGIQEASSVAGVVRTSFKGKPGDILGPLISSGCRQGYVLAVADTGERALRQVKAACSLVMLKTAPV